MTGISRRIRPGQRIEKLRLEGGKPFTISGIVNQVYLNGEEKPLISPKGERLTKNLPAGAHGGDENVPGITIANWHYGEARLVNAFLSEDNKGAYIKLL